MVDITKLKIAEESLKKSEEHFRALVEKSGIAILIDDEEGNLLYCNSRYADNFGYSMEEMRGQPISAIVHSDDVERVMTYHRGRLQGKDVPSRYEFKGIRKDGSVIYLEVDASVLREGERLIGTRSYMWDITDRKLAEENLRKRSARLELVHHIQSGIPLSADIEAVLNQTAESIGKTFGYYKISVNLYDRATNEIEYLTGWNKTGLSLPRGHRQKLGQGLIGKAGLLKQTILANDVSKEPDYIPYHLTETKAELVIPLLVQDHLIGVLDLQAAEVDAFSKEDIAVLESVASYIAFIIDRKKREEALQESEEKFRNLAEQSPNMIFINKRGRVVYANKKCEEIMGYKKEEIYSPDFNFLVLIAPEFRDEVKASFLKHMNGIEGELLQYSLLTKEGKRIEVLQNSKLIDYEKDKAILGIVTDITERKRAEAVLLERESKLKTLFEILPVGVSIIDAERKIFFMNSALGRILEISKEGLFRGDYKSRTYLKSDGTPMPAEEFASARAIKEQRAVYNIETGVVKEDGNVIWTSVSAVPVTFPDWKVVIVTADITERKQAEEALRESEEKYRTLVENAAEAILIAQDGMLKFVNHAASEISGYSEQELRSSPFLEFVHPDDRDMVGERYLRRLKGDVSVPRYTFRLMNKDGSIKWVEIDAVLVDWEGKPATLNFLSDITERKRAEEELRNSEERFKFIFEYAPDAYYLSDLKGNFIDGNKAAEKLTGYKREELIGKHFLKLGLLSLDQLHEAATLLANNAVGKTHGPDEFMVKKKDPAVKSLWKSRTYPVKFKEQALVLGIARDITERKKAEQTLRENEEKYRTLTENIKIGVYRNTVGPQGRFLEANRSMVKMFGFKSKNKFMAGNLSDFNQNEEDREAFNEKMIKKGYVRNEELFLKKNDGTPFIGSVSAVAVKDARGNVKYYDGTIEDITKRKQTEDELQQAVREDKASPGKHCECCRRQQLK